MMQFLETTLGRIILLIVVGAIWGVNAFNFSKLANQEESAAQSRGLEFITIELPAENTYRYTVRNRDPFARGNSPVLQGPRSTTEIERMPNIRLIGIMGTTSILQIDNGETVIKEAGEVVIGDVVLETVFEDSVHLTFNDKTITIKLNY